MVEMDRAALLAKLKSNKKSLLIGALALALLGGGAGFFLKGKKGGDHGASTHAEKGKASSHEAQHADEHGATKAAEKDAHASEAHEAADPDAHLSGFQKIVKSFKDAVVSVHDGVLELSRAQQDNERLRLENANLRRWSEELRFNCRIGDNKNHIQKVGMKLTQETGAKAGRILATIDYSPPTHLLPSQLYTLGISYFKADEFEKAAVILTFLTGMEDNDTFKTPRNILLTAVTWYRLDHYKLSDHYLDKVISVPDSSENLQIKAHARLWKALVSERLNDHSQSQQWLTDLLDHHPQSPEARWINGGEILREPASTKKKTEKPAAELKSEEKTESPETPEAAHSEQPAHGAHSNEHH